MTIRISIIVPCFNAEPYLREAIGSARFHRQAVEVIIVDDGSTDESLAVAEQFAHEVKIIRQPNSGVSAARNAGIAAAVGEYCLFLDADDVLVAGAIDRFSDVAAAGQALVMLGSTEFDDRTGATPGNRVPPEALFPTILMGNPGIIGSWMAPTETLRGLGGFRRDMAVFEDWELVARLAFTGVELRTSDFVGVRYRRHPQSCIATSRSAKRASGHVQVMASMCQQIWARPDVLQDYGDVLFWLAWGALERGHYFGANKSAVRRLEAELNRFVSEGPPSVRDTRLGRVTRLLGSRATGSIRLALHRAIRVITPWSQSHLEPYRTIFPEAELSKIA